MRLLTAAALAVLLFAPPVGAQTLGTFNWRLAPLGSVLSLTVTQRGGLYELFGVELQCGGNRTLPVTGMAVPQANGQVLIGVTTINESGRGLHTTAFISTSNFSGSWSDNTGYSNQPFQLVGTAAPVCPGGLRTDPISGDQPGGTP